MSKCPRSQEVEQALASLNRRSVPGNDGLTTEMCWWTFGAASSIGAGGIGEFLLSEGKV